MGLILGLYIGILEEKMETTILGLGFGSRSPCHAPHHVLIMFHFIVLGIFLVMVPCHVTCDFPFRSPSLIIQVRTFHLVKVSLAKCLAPTSLNMCKDMSNPLLLSSSLDIFCEGSRV